MIRIIKNWLCAFKNTLFLSQQDKFVFLLEEEYNKIFNEIRNSNSITDLLIVRKKIAIFKKYIDKSNTSDYALVYYEKLMVCWNHKYKLYKITKARG